ncbi:hypothetical protein CR513_00831, partial [Mucuna pruriens]
MPTSIYKSLNFYDLEPTGMIIQLANRRVVQLLDMEDETLGKGFTLILGQPFLMTARTKIDVHARTLSMEFSDNLVQFKIFKAMKHPTEDPTFFGIDIIDELVEEHMQLDTSNVEFLKFAGDTDVFDYLGSISDKADYDKLWECATMKNQSAQSVQKSKLHRPKSHYQRNREPKATRTVKVGSTSKPNPFWTIKSDFNVKKKVESDSSNQTRAESNSANLSWKQSKAETKLAHLVLNLNQVDQSNPRPTNDISPSPSSPAKLKPLLSHLKYAYRDDVSNPL